jgi:hypothetical protein
MVNIKIINFSYVTYTLLDTPNYFYFVLFLA